MIYFVTYNSVMWNISKEHTVEISDQQWELEYFVNIVISALVFIKARGYALYDTSLLRIFTLKFVTLLLKKVMTVPSGTLRAAHC